MHDPRRPEVPELDQDAAVQDATVLINRIRNHTVGYLGVAEFIVSVYKSGAIAGMRAQYEHDQKAARSA